jgi:predicted mannosyl-3-phosphoglycerate phosphatase (HAD superfamily)
MNEYEGLSVEELRTTLRRLRGDLQDLEETFNFNLTHTQAHLARSAVVEHETELNEYREKIVRVLEALNRLGQPEEQSGNA